MSPSTKPTLKKSKQQRKQASLRHWKPPTRRHAHTIIPRWGSVRPTYLTHQLPT